jgi:hypothetical protein
MDQMAQRVNTVWKATECCAAAGTVARIPGAVSLAQLVNTVNSYKYVYYNSVVKLMLFTLCARTAKNMIYMWHKKDKDKHSDSYVIFCGGGVLDLCG